MVFKYTSNQHAIKRVRNDINANLLALKLFKDSATVALKAQGRLLLAAGKLFVFALVPMLVMALPVTLLLGQIALWYEARPLRVGEQALITLKLGGKPDTALPQVNLAPTDAVDVELGPVRVRSKREVCWNVKAKKPGSHLLMFQVGDTTVAKEFAVGDGFMRVSAERPGWNWESILLNPWEEPFRPDEPGAIDLDRLSRATVDNERHFLVDDLLVRGLDGRRAVLQTRAEGQFLNGRSPGKPRSLVENEIVIVSGLPRSGTSLMMQMLDKGGLGSRHRQRPHARHRQSPRLLRARAGQTDQGRRVVAARDAGNSLQDGFPAPL